MIMNHIQLNFQTFKIQLTNKLLKLIAELPESLHILFLPQPFEKLHYCVPEIVWQFLQLQHDLQSSLEDLHCRSCASLVEREEKHKDM